MEPNFIVEPSYTKKEMRQFAKEYWEKYINTRFISIFRIITIVYMSVTLIVTLTGLVLMKNMFFWIFLMLFGMIFVVIWPKLYSFCCIGVGVNLLGSIFNKTVHEKVAFYDDYVNCIQFKNILYRGIEITEQDDQFALKFEKYYLLVKKSDITKGSYDDLLEFLDSKRMEPSSIK